MVEKLQGVYTKILAWWNKFTTKQKSIIIGIAATVIFAFAILTYVLTKPQYERFMICESATDAAEIVDILESADIPYEGADDGMVIRVRTEDVTRANWAVASAGYTPEDYSSLQDVLSGSMSTTSADKEKYYKEHMQRQLELDLAEFSNVKSAIVNLDIPQQDGTIIAEKQEASAFIQLELDGTFTSAHAANIAKGVAAMLGNETTANITILDMDSNLLFAGGDDYSTAGIASSMQELQNQAESMVANQVKKVLLGTYQYDNIVVTGHLAMDFASYNETVNEYYANAGREEGMLAHRGTYESENENGVGGDPGTDSNNENSYMYQDSSNSSSSQSEVEEDFLPNQSIVNKVTPAGGIDYDDSSVSIAALRYREVYEEDVERQGLLDVITWEEYKYANSGDKKLEVDPDFYSMVASATGISEDRITIVAYETPLFVDKEKEEVDWNNVASIVVLVVILALLAFVVLRSMRSKAETEEEEELSVENLLQSTPEAELEDIDVEAKSEIRKVIEKFVDDNPEAAAALLRNWLNEDWT